jgi:ABC-2 type transport system permease protein
MSVAWHVARRSCAQHATYRWATFAGAFTNTVFGFLRVYVLLAVLDARPGLAGFSDTDAASYAFVTQGLLAALAFGYPELAERIRTGDVVVDLYRPVDLQAWMLAADLGRAAYHLVFRFVPPVAAGALVFGIGAPPDPLAWCACAASIALGIVISFGYRFITALSGFWLLDIRGAWQIATMVAWFFAGLVVPLTFLPDPLRDVARLLPFAGMAQLPLELYLGHHPAAIDVASVLGRQVAWAVVLLVIGRWVAGRAMRKVVVQGG